MKRRLWSLLALSALLALCGFVACDEGEGNGGGNGGSSSIGSSSSIGGHTHGYALKNYLAPTCTQEGRRMHYACSCGELFNESYMPISAEDTVIPASHQLSEREAQPGGCTYQGTLAHWYCDACQKYFSDEAGTTEITQEQTLTGFRHSLSAVAAVAATCTQEGNVAYYHCPDCYTIFSDESATTKLYLDDLRTPIIPHSFNANLLCTGCNMHKPTEGLVFERSSYGVFLKSLGETTDTEIYIPEEVEYEGALCEVKGIYAECFSETQKQTVVSVHIPKSVVYFQSPWSSDHTNVFRDCTALTSITVDENNGYFKAVDGILYNKEGTELLVYPQGKTATEFTVNNTVTAIGDRAFQDNARLQSVDLGEMVTEVKISSFENCSALRTVTAPALQTIGSRAFHSCVSFNSGVYAFGNLQSIGSSAFYGCTSFRWLTLPQNVTSIGSSAFSNCKNLLSVNLNSALQTIESYAFEYCYKLISVKNYSFLSITKGSDDNGGVAKYAINVITDESTVTTSFETVGDYTFYDGVEGNYLVSYNGTETTLRLPDFFNGQPYEIAPYAFYGDTSLEYVTLSDYVTAIGKNAFSGCYSLTGLTLSVLGAGSENITPFNWIMGVTVHDQETFQNFDKIVWRGGDIPKNAFYGCTFLKRVEVQAKNFKIGAQAFAYCANLTDFYIGNGEAMAYTEIGEDAFRGTALTSFSTSTNLSKIGQHAFWNCRQLASLYINSYDLTTAPSIVDGDLNSSVALTVYFYSAVPVIPASMFAGCARLQSVVCDQSTIMETIERNAFNGCTNLTDIDIPASVTTIEENAFRNCNKLTDVNFLGTTDQWAQIQFGYTNMVADANPLEYSKSLKINGEKVTDLSFSELSTTSISSFAFIDCDFTSVTIHDYITTVGANAFGGCVSIQTLHMPMNFLSAFDAALFSDGSPLQTLTVINGEVNLYGADVKKVVLGNGVTSCSFANCANLTEITLGTGITSVNADAFSGCEALTKVHYAGTIDEWAKISFGNELANPLTYGELYIDGHKVEGEISLSSTTQIGNYAFANSKFTKISVGNNVTSIGNYAFKGCNALEEIVLPFTVEFLFGGTAPASLKKVSVNGGAVENTEFNASNITTLTLGDEVTALSYRSFSNCASLSEITLGAGIKKLSSINGLYPFKNCNALTKVNYTGTADQWVAIDFEEESNPLAKTKTLYIDGQAATELTLTNATTIRPFAFTNCHLTKITLGKNITIVHRDAFKGATVDAVYYAGSMAEWENVTFYSGNTALLLNVYCYDEATDGYLPFVSACLVFTLSEDESFYSVSGSNTNPNLAMLVIPETYDGVSVERIDNFAFRVGIWQGILLIKLPASITTIGTDAFGGIIADNVIVYYEGTETEWNAITMNSGNNALQNATRYYAEA